MCVLQSKMMPRNDDYNKYEQTFGIPQKVT